MGIRSIKFLVLGLYFIPLFLFLVGFLLLTVDLRQTALEKVSVTRRQLVELIENVSTSRQHTHDQTGTTEHSTTAVLDVTQFPCDEIHLVIPMFRHTDALLLLKSLLFYRHSPLHFHFIVSKDYVEKATHKLMKTWRLPGVNFTVYNVPTRYLSAFAIPNNALEFSAATKLLLPQILSPSIEKVIYVDAGFIVKTPIEELWIHFYRIHDTHSSLRFGTHDLKATFCNLTSSILLFNLKAMRLYGWYDLQFSSGDVPPSTVLCNTVKTMDHFTIPCSWNLDLNNGNAGGCVNTTIEQIKAFHGWDSSDSVSNSKHPKYFTKLQEFISLYDSSLLTYIPLSCVNSQIVELNEEAMITKALANGQDKMMCQILKKQSKRVLRTIMYFYGEPYKPKDKYETTLVTQLSLDRLRTFSLLVKQWDGPISIAMYGSDVDARAFVEFISTFKVLSKRKNVNVHVVFQEGKFYPVNYLRNTALGAVTTPYVFLNDGDFIPKTGLFDYLKKATNSLIEKRKGKTLLVIPAFETAKFTLKFPKTKQQLLQLIRQKLVSQFCVSCAHKTHAPTDYRLWFKSRDPYVIEWAFHFEPYVVVQSSVAKYDERFIGYGFNKVSQITELKAQGYQFIVLPEAFIIHTPHPPSIDKKIWEHKSFKKCINSIWIGFLDDLKAKYGKNCLKEKKANPVIIRS